MSFGSREGFLFSTDLNLIPFQHAFSVFLQRRYTLQASFLQHSFQKYTVDHKYPLQVTFAYDSGLLLSMRVFVFLKISILIEVMP